MGNKGQKSLGMIVGIAVFIISKSLFRFSFLASVFLAIITYIIVYNRTKAKYKFGNVDIDSLAHSGEIKELLNAAHEDLRIIKSASVRAKHKPIRENARKLNNTGNNILDYLKKNPKRILTARRFLSYYLDTAADILEKYLEFVATNVENEEMNKIYYQTNRGLTILNGAFEKQFMKLMENEFFDIEAEINVLEKTLKMEE